MSEYCNDHEVDPILSRTSHGKLFSINEEEQREALKGFYERYLTNFSCVGQCFWEASQCK